MNLKNEITKIHYNIKSNAWLDPILDFMSIFYSIITEIRNDLFDRGIFAQRFDHALGSSPLTAFTAALGAVM